VFEDTRPVVVDDTAPLPGLVLNADLDALLGSLTPAQFRAALAAALGGSSSPAAASTLVEVADASLTAGDPALTTANASSNRAAAIAAALADVPDADLEADTAVSNSTAVAGALASALASTQAASDAAAEAAAAAAPNTTIPAVGVVPGTSVAVTAGPSVWRTDATFVSLTGVPDADFSPAVNWFSLSWEPFLDTGSGIAALGYCLGSRPYTCDLRPMARVRPRLAVDSINVTELALPAGAMVYATVAAVNGMGMVSLATSNGMRPDDRAPGPGLVYDVGAYFAAPLARTGAASAAATIAVDIDCDVAGGGLGAAWEGFDSAAGIARYEWAVGTAPGADDILAWADVGLASSGYDAAGSAPVGEIVFASVRAVAKNGRSTVASSDGMRVISADADADVGSAAAAAAGLRADTMFVCVAVPGVAAAAGSGAGGGSSSGSGGNATLAGVAGVLGLTEDMFIAE
jgi:hypothetical protein